MVTFGQIEDKMLKIISGNGSADSPILFEPSTRAARISSEREFVCGKYGAEGRDWSEGIHFTSIGREALLSHWSIDLSDGTHRSIYFDTSNTID